MNAHRPYGVAIVAAFEALKGVLALVVGAGALTLLHHDVAQFAERLVAHFHLNPARAHPRIFVDALARIHDTQLLAIAAGTAVYAALRLVMATGLWCGKEWAEWLTAVCAGIYIPLEIYELTRGLSGIRLTAFLGNILIVLLMVAAIRRRRQALS